MSTKQPAATAPGRDQDDENLKQISMTISAADLAEVDALAKKQRISRAAFIRQSIQAAVVAAQKEIK